MPCFDHKNSSKSASLPSRPSRPRAKQDDLDRVGCGHDAAGYFLEVGFGELVISHFKSIYSLNTFATQEALILPI